MRKKLLLINPVNPETKRLAAGRSRLVPKLALGLLAALTPDNWDVEIFDESFEPFQYRKADLVGLTAFTENVNRAYEISGIYRGKNVTTVLGGVHASFLPEEALQYVDTVVKGEAESVWQEVIADFEAGKVQRVYQGEFMQLEGMPLPRYELFHPKLRLGTLQMTRGCPMNCNFCSVTAFNGNRYRHRPVEQVLDELERMPYKRIFFTDDNIVGHGKRSEERALALFKGIVERGIKINWTAHASMNVADNEEILEYAAKSGCRMLLLGVDAETSDALSEINKKMNLRSLENSYEEAFRRLHRHKVAVHGFFIFGLDVDTPETLHQRADYITRSGVDSMGPAILCPFPGTALFDKMREENRLLYTNFPEDWSRYNFSQVVYKPSQMEPQELEQIMDEILERLFSYKVIYKKFFRTFLATGSMIPAVAALVSNLDKGKAFAASRKGNVRT